MKRLQYYLLTRHCLIPRILFLTLLYVIPASSQQRWERIITGDDDQEGLSVKQTTDGGYIVAGYRFYSSPPQGYYGLLLKVSAYGGDVWTRIRAGAVFYSVNLTTDGGYICSGNTGTLMRDVYLYKADSSGFYQWAGSFGGTGWDCGYSVQQTQDGGYIIAGTYNEGTTNPQVYLIKTNSSGDTLWTRTFGGSSTEGGSSVQQTQDGGYIVAGKTSSFGDSTQVYLIKTNFIGDTLWTRTYGGVFFDEGKSVQQTTDGGYIIAGVTNSYGNGNEDVYLIKTNSIGDILWTRTFGGASRDRGSSVQQTTDGGYIIAGFTESFGLDRAVYLIKTDENGNVGTERGQGFEGPRVQGLKITPNPFISFATLPGHEAERFVIYDISGRKVGTYKGDRIGEGLIPGVYFLKPESREARPLRVVKIR